MAKRIVLSSLQVENKDIQQLPVGDSELLTIRVSGNGLWVMMYHLVDETDMSSGRLRAFMVRTVGDTVPTEYTYLYTTMHLGKAYHVFVEPEFPRPI